MPISLHTRLQYLLPHRFCCKIISFLANNKIRWWKNWAIKRFIRVHHVLLEEALDQNIENYPTFNDFFIRKLQPLARPISEDPLSFVSPADGTLSEFGSIEKNNLIQAKEQFYTLEQLLAGESTLAQSLLHGWYATFYLAPHNYHRVHIPCDGKLKAMWHVPGHLFSVNPATLMDVPSLFAVNERMICLFETRIGEIVLIFVGAFFVGSIHTVWSGEIKVNSKVTHYSYENQTISFKKGDEIGHFRLGSTVILLFPQQGFSFSDLEKNQSIHMGERIGTFTHVP